MASSATFCLVGIFRHLTLTEPRILSELVTIYHYSFWIYAQYIWRYSTHHGSIKFLRRMVIIVNSPSPIALWKIEKNLMLINPYICGYEKYLPNERQIHVLLACNWHCDCQDAICPRQWTCNQDHLEIRAGACVLEAKHKELHRPKHHFAFLLRKNIKLL